MPNPLPSDQRRFAAESPFDAAFGYGSAPISTPTSEGRHDSSQTAGRAADEDGLQPADTPAELTGPVWVVDDDDVRESLTFALQPRFEAASYPTLEAFLTQADLMQPGCLVIPCMYMQIICFKLSSLTASPVSMSRRLTNLMCSMNWSFDAVR